MEFAEKNGAFAVGIDIDHVFGETGDYDCCFGNWMTYQTEEDLQNYVKATGLPFVVERHFERTGRACVPESGSSRYCGQSSPCAYAFLRFLR